MSKKKVSIDKKKEKRKKKREIKTQGLKKEKKKSGEHIKKIKTKEVLKELSKDESKINSIARKTEVHKNYTFVVKQQRHRSNPLTESPWRTEIQKRERNNEFDKDLSKLVQRRGRGSRPAEMAAGITQPTNRGRKGIPANKPRKKPHSLPPLPRTPKSPVNDAEKQHDAREIRRLIGSPPPSGFLKRVSSGSLNIISVPRESWNSDSDRADTPYADEDQTVYAPISSLETSQPRITLAKAPKEGSLDENELLNETIVVSATPSRKSLQSIASLVHSASALSLNSSQSSLTLPPKLLSYKAEDGSAAVQEWVSADKISRRSSTPSIRELPNPLEGASPLEVDPTSPPNNKHSKYKKLQPLKKR